jgi:hypothetical protein
VTLTALVAAPPGASGHAEELEWAMCLARKPLTELGPVARECITRFGAGGEIFRRLGRGPAVSSTVPAEACRLFGPLSAPTEAGGVAGRPVDPDLSGGYHEPVVVGSAVGTALATVRLACGITGVPNAEVVRYNQGYRPNENPELERIEIATGGTIEPAGTRVRAGTRIDLRAVWASCPSQAACGDGLCTTGENQSNCAADCRSSPKGCTGAETYLRANPETRAVEERLEAITVAWYASGGTFASEQTDGTNAWTAPSSPGPVNVWVVLRDDRGGVGWQESVVEVVP